jgi:hypothetical protein
MRLLRTCDVVSALQIITGTVFSSPKSSDELFSKVSCIMQIWKVKYACQQYHVWLRDWQLALEAFAFVTTYNPAVNYEAINLCVIDSQSIDCTGNHSFTDVIIPNKYNAPHLQRLICTTLSFFLMTSWIISTLSDTNGFSLRLEYSMVTW